jgi:hypothetical protein
MFRKVTDGPDAGVGCHGLDRALPPCQPARAGGRAFMEPRPSPFGSRPRLRSRYAET